MLVVLKTLCLNFIIFYQFIQKLCSDYNIGSGDNESP